MATVSTRAVQQEAEFEGAPPPATSLEWGNSTPLALLAFAVTTFMLSMVNANAVAPGVLPVVFGVALMFGGLAQLIAGSRSSYSPSSSSAPATTAPTPP